MPVTQPWVGNWRQERHGEWYRKTGDHICQNRVDSLTFHFWPSRPPLSETKMPFETRIAIQDWISISKIHRSNFCSHWQTLEKVVRETVSFVFRSRTGFENNPSCSNYRWRSDSSPDFPSTTYVDPYGPVLNTSETRTGSCERTMHYFRLCFGKLQSKPFALLMG